MEMKTVLERYARYFEFLQKLGNIPMSETPTIEDLDLTKGVIQSGYKEIKEADFEGSLVDYLCYIDTLYIGVMLEKFMTKKASLRDICLYIIHEMYRHSPLDVNNVLRLAMKNPSYLFELLGKNEKIDVKIDGFKELYGLWLKKFLTNEIQPS